MSLIATTLSSPEKSASRKLGAADFWLLGLRALCALSMIYYQSWHQALRAWDFVWSQKEWKVADTIAGLGLPQPSVIAVTLVFLLLAAPFGILIGFLTRFNAMMLLLAAGFVLFSHLDNVLSTTLNPQSLLLYLGMALILALSGGGMLSLDALMTRRRHAKKKD